MEMKEKLIEMLKLQKSLDERIVEQGDYPYDEMKIGLMVELGELMNEMPTVFKHWKKTAVDDKDKALVEAVDCVHFWLSLWLYMDGKRVSERKYARLAQELSSLFESSKATYKNLSVQRTVANTFSSPMSNLPSLIYALGFTFDEIYEGYLAKNKVNHERQDKNY